MNWKKTITAGISALAISGVLFGAGLTSTAHAATTTPTAAGEVTPQSSINFGVTNGLSNVTLQLAGVYGRTEGHPPIGSTMTFGQRQSFEVQDMWFADDDVFVTYQVHVDGQGYVGDIQLQLSLAQSGERTTKLTVNNTPIAMRLGGGGTQVTVNAGYYSN